MRSGLIRTVITPFLEVKLCKVIDFVGFNLARFLIKKPKFVLHGNPGNEI